MRNGQALLLFRGQPLQGVLVHLQITVREQYESDERQPCIRFDKIKHRGEGNVRCLVNRITVYPGAYGMLALTFPQQLLSRVCDADFSDYPEIQIQQEQHTVQREGVER